MSLDDIEDYDEQCSAIERPTRRICSTISKFDIVVIQYEQFQAERAHIHKHMELLEFRYTPFTEIEIGILQNPGGWEHKFPFLRGAPSI